MSATTVLEGIDDDAMIFATEFEELTGWISRYTLEYRQRGFLRTAFRRRQGRIVPDNDTLHQGYSYIYTKRDVQLALIVRAIHEYRLDWEMFNRVADVVYSGLIDGASHLVLTSKTVTTHTAAEDAADRVLELTAAGELPCVVSLHHI